MEVDRLSDRISKERKLIDVCPKFTCFYIFSLDFDVFITCLGNTPVH
jgi:hypothetical protein